MKAEIEQRALAFVNMYGVLGSLENLCEIDPVAREICAGIEEPVSLAFAVAGGPACTFTFGANGCVMTDGTRGADMKMSFAAPALFNKMVESGIPGVPTRGPLRTLKFLMGDFTKLTDRLNEVLRPAEEALRDRAFFEENTLMTMYVIAGAIPALANNDSISRISAGATVDGDIRMSIPGYATVTLRVSDHVFSTVKKELPNPRATMEFADIDLAYGLFNGTVSTINEMCTGRIKLAGMISMIDNVNRILDRVAVYLA